MRMDLEDRSVACLSRLKVSMAYVLDAKNWLLGWSDFSGEIHEWRYTIDIEAVLPGPWLGESGLRRLEWRRHDGLLVRHHCTSLNCEIILILTWDWRCDWDWSHRHVVLSWTHHHTVLKSKVALSNELILRKEAILSWLSHD